MKKLVSQFGNLYLLSFFLFLPVRTLAMANQIDQTWISSVENLHDLTLPAWGPFTKGYIGVSHVSPANDGLRFDLSVFPGLYSRKVVPPNVLFESDYHLWDAVPDLSYFSYRFEMEWKDQVYADVSYAKLDEHSRLIRAECVNNTDIPQNLELHLVANMNFPVICPDTVKLPWGAVWVNAIDYDNMHYAKGRPTDNLVNDGKMRGEIRTNDFVDGSGLGEGFGTTRGDTADYRFSVKGDLPQARLVVRYRMSLGAKTVLRLDGLVNSLVDFTGNGSLETRVVNLGDLSSGIQKLTITALGSDEIELNGFVLVTASNIDHVAFVKQDWDPKPTIIPGPRTNSLILKYKDVDDYYGLAWVYNQFQVRQFFCSDLDVFFQEMIQNHVNDMLKGEGNGHYTDVFLRPISMAPHTRRVVYATVCDGSLAEVQQRLAAPEPSVGTCEAIYTNARTRLSDLQPAPQGESFEFSQKRMAAMLLGNVVYPIYTQRSYIKHNTPGRWWDSLYTWDSGFIALGLADLDLRRSLECMNTYLTPPGAQSAFIHHGSMVPVQFYVFLDLWNRTQSHDLLEYAYPRLKQYYEFYVGHLGSSSMGKFKSGVLTSFDYFYNSGGWDDYPPQKYTSSHKLGAHMAPVVITAQAIRIAKIMVMAADALGKKDDIRNYNKDIAFLTQALETNSWDEASGYFAYTQYNENNQLTGILKFDGRVNYDMGLDGVYPLVAGVGTKEQTKLMLDRLESPEHLWSSVGLSAVDQSAPYYRNDGYWNGTVWMPHQWFFWKSMLDLGEDDFAWDIANRGLKVWRNEVDTSYNCMEFFPIETGRGAGWHEFGGLSAPVLKWYSAYCRPGTLTTGFNVWVTGQQFAPDDSNMEAELKLFFYTGATQDHSSLVVCMNPAFIYQVKWNGTVITPKEIAKGLLEIEIPARDGVNKLVISKVREQ